MQKRTSAKEWILMPRGLLSSPTLRKLRSMTQNSYVTPEVSGGCDYPVAPQVVHLNALPHNRADSSRAMTTIPVAALQIVVALSDC